MSTKVVAAFLERVQRSGLVPEQRLSQLRQEFEIQGVNLDDPNAVAAALVERGAVTQWQAEKLLQGKHKGFFLGSYRLLRPLGKGGMGAVFLAQHEMMRRQCAIKVLPQTQIDKHSSVLERFYVEAQAVASLDHQNIVRAYDVSKEVKDNKEIHYLVMEFVEGQDAQVTVQENGVLDYVKAAEVVRQTANGLAHAHENGLIHRDIKPANLLIDKKGVVKILDLGLARFHDDSGAASLTAAHNETVLGTADYLSPEQALNSHNVDQRTDIYSLGCTAYFLVTGHPPFPEGSVAQRLVAHQVKSPKPIAEERADAPPELTAIISKMMAKNPDDRYQNAGEIATVLAAWLVQHGGEDWRRQHSEITGDSSILNLLSQHREPTRAMSSAMSETELELAPEDEEPAKPSSGSALKSKSSPAVRSGKSAVGTKKKFTDDVDLTLAEDEEAAPPVASPPSQGPKSKAEKAPTPMVLEELPPLTKTEPEPLPVPDLLPELPAEDALASLDQEDLMGPSESGSSLGAIESHVKLAPARGPSSSTKLRGAKKEPERKPKTLMQSIQAIGLPILIGIGGGLLLVLIIILFFLFSGGSQDTELSSRRPPAGAAPGGTPSQPQTPGEAGVATSAPEATNAKEPVVSPPLEPAPAPTTPSPIVPQTPPQAAPATPTTTPPTPVPGVQPQPQPEPGKAGTQPAGESPTPQAVAEPGTGASGRKQGKKQPKQPAGQVPNAGRTEPPQLGPETLPPATLQPAGEPAPTPPAPAAKPTVEPQPPPAAPAKPPIELFAGLTEFSLEVKLGGDPKSIPKELNRGLDFLQQSLRTKLQGAEKIIDLKVVEQSNQAVLEVVMTPSLDPPHLVLNLSAQLKCQSEGASVVVWSADSQTQTTGKAEVFRFVPTQFDARSTPGLWQTKVLDFFKPLGADHREARKAFGKSN